jgi:hypothetical protein
MWSINAISNPDPVSSPTAECHALFCIPQARVLFRPGSHQLLRNNRNSAAHPHLYKTFYNGLNRLFVHQFAPQKYHTSSWLHHPRSKHRSGGQTSPSGCGDLGSIPSHFMLDQVAVEHVLSELLRFYLTNQHFTIAHTYLSLAPEICNNPDRQHSITCSD